MVLPGRRAAGLIGGAGVLFAVGTNVQAGWVLAIAALLLGAAVAGLILPGRMVRGIDVERRARDEASAGGSVEVDLIVRNRGRRTKLSVLIRDDFVAPATALVPSLGPHARVRVVTRREPARRGIVEGEPVVLASSAPFGVGTARRRVRASGRTVVYPRVVPLPRLAVLERPARPEPASQPTPRRGHGQDFMGMREYRPGDSLRHVHWPSTARHGTLIVREFEREEPRRLTILVDTLADAGPGPDGVESALDMVCAAAASAAVHALEAGAVITLGAPAADGRVRVLRGPRRGEALEFLAGLRPTGAGLDAALESDELETDAVLVAAGTWSANAERVARLASSLAATGASVQVVLVDAATFGRGGEPALDPEGAGRLGAAVAGAGGIVSRVAAGQPLAAALAGSR